MTLSLTALLHKNLEFSPSLQSGSILRAVTRPISYVITTKFGRLTANEGSQTYEEGRSEKDFVEWLNEKTGTHRAVGGGLNDVVGDL